MFPRQTPPLQSMAEQAIKMVLTKTFGQVETRDLYLVQIQVGKLSFSSRQREVTFSLLSGTSIGTCLCICRKFSN